MEIVKLSCRQLHCCTAVEAEETITGLRKKQNATE